MCSGVICEFREMENRDQTSSRGCCAASVSFSAIKKKSSSTSPVSDQRNRSSAILHHKGRREGREGVRGPGDHLDYSSVGLMAPRPLVLLVLLLRLCSASACEANSISNLSCHFNYEKRISCVWSTDRTDACSLHAQNLNIYGLTYFQSYSSSSALTATPSWRSCSLQFKNTVRIKPYHVLSLKLSCVHMNHSLETRYKPMCHVKLDAPDAPVVNGSSLFWTKALTKATKDLDYEVQWTPQHRPWTDGWSRNLQLDCSDQCSAELRVDTLVLGQNYNARVRVRVYVSSLSSWSEWSEWSLNNSWTSAVGRSQETARQIGSDGLGSDKAGLWTTVFVVIFTLAFIMVLFWTSRVHWVYMIKVVKGAPLPSPAPSVLKMGWETPPFISHSYFTFFNPVDIIASVELLPPQPRPSLHCASPPKEDPASPCLSNISNPIYSELCPHPTSDPDQDADQDLDPESEELPSVSLPELQDLLQLLCGAQQSQGSPVVCDYERVEQVGVVGEVGELGERGRLTSVDSGVGSGEEVSQESLHLNDKTDVSTRDAPMQLF